MTSDTTGPYRLRETLMWNLYEGLETPDAFALSLVQDLDLPNRVATATAIREQIRQQLDEYAEIALHPLFKAVDDGTFTDEDPAVNNPDDAYRCIVSLNICRINELFTDKFEWSLLHPADFVNKFAKTTCRDLGLTPDWAVAISHGIHEAVMKIKKEVIEKGGLSGAPIDNMAANGQLAGVRYDPEGLGEEWGPKIQTLTQPEMEKRDVARERDSRRLRREAARFNGGPTIGTGTLGGHMDSQDASEGGMAPPMGRSKRKRKRRSQTPVERGNTPRRKGTPNVGGGGGGHPNGITDAYVLLVLCYFF